MLLLIVLVLVVFLIIPMKTWNRIVKIIRKCINYVVFRPNLSNKIEDCSYLKGSYSPLVGDVSRIVGDVSGIVGSYIDFHYNK